MSIISAGTTTTTALSSTGNTDGTLQLQVNGTTPSVTLNALGAVGVGAVPNFGTSGQALVSAGSTAAPTWTTIAASPWATSGSNISYTAGQVQISTGSAAAPALSVASDTNTGVFFPAADTIAFAEGGVESMRLDSSGNLGLGVTPSAWGTQRALDFAYGGLSIGTGLGVELVGNTFWNGANWIYKVNGPSFRYEQDSAGHKWYNAASGTAGNTASFTQAMTLDASGNLLVGTTSQLATGLTNTITKFQTPSSTSTAWADQVSPLVVYGNFGFGGGSQQQSSALTVVGWSSFGTPGAIMRGWWSSNQANLGTPVLQFQVAATGNVTNTNNSYGSLSDERLKENITDATPKLENLNKLRVVNFNLKADPDKLKQIGLIAQEVEAVFPGLVETDGEGDKSVKYSVLVPMLLKAVQEQQAMIEQLKADVVALKGQA